VHLNLEKLGIGWGLLYNVNSMRQEGDPCLDCSVRKMLREGCCIPDVGDGTKLITNGLTRVSVCANLVVNQGSPYCGIWGSHPEACRSFRCGAKMRYDAGA
jgi:hypothetical protein